MTNEFTRRAIEKKYEVIPIDPFLSVEEYLKKASKLGATGIRGSGIHRVAYKPVPNETKLENSSPDIR